MSVLEDLKQHFINKGITLPIHINMAPADSGNIAVLWNYDGTASDIGRNSRVQFCVKNTDMSEAQRICDELYDLVYPKGQFKKVILINDKPMHIKPIQTPFYSNMDEKSRHNYIFNANINFNRN